jgi:hypothetical protein
MSNMQDVKSLEMKRDKLRKELATIGDLRPGSLIARYRKCGKANCHCAREGDPGHGPSWSLTHKVRGKTVTKIIPEHAVSKTQEQIAEYHRLRRLVAELIEVSERICDAGVLAASATSEGGAKKGALKKSTEQRSSLRLKHS